jgi:tetratricopeptide (TPR) repeat protein
MKGRHYWNKRTEEGLRHSVEHLKRALELDPRYALALAGLADSYVTLGIYGAAPPREVMPLAKAAAEHALALDERLAEALAGRGCVRALFDWDWTGAEADFKRGIEINPRHPTAHQWYAINCLAPQGRFQDAWAALARARELDPVSPAINATAGLLHYFEREYERAVDECRTVLEMDAGFALAHYFLGLAYSAQGRHDEALSTLREAVRLSAESPEAVAALSHACGAAGRRGAAAEVLAQLQASAERRYVSPVLVAQAYTGIGDLAAAFGWLAKGRDVRAAELAWLAVRPVFDPLKADDRFAALCREIGVGYGGSAKGER